MADAEVFIAVNVFGTQVTGGHTLWSTKTHNRSHCSCPFPLHVDFKLVLNDSKFLRFVKVPR